MTSKQISGAVATILIHLLVVYLLWPSSDSSPTSPPPPPPSSNEIQVRLIPREAEKQEPEGPRPGMDGAPDPKICEGKSETYTGIGIIHSMGTQLIISAPAGYPAYDNGLRVGDEIISIEESKDPSILLVHVLRDHSIHIKKKIRKEKICFTELSK